MSRFTVRVFASGMFSAFGHSPTLAVRDFEGEAKFSPDALDEARLKIKIQAGIAYGDRQHKRQGSPGDWSAP